MEESSRKRLISTDTSWLRCPRCRSEYLHQGTVTVFDRLEDDLQTAVTTVYRGLTATHYRSSSAVDNPSSRRQGLAVAFWCERCCEEGEELIEFTIAQHKGTTEYAWRYVPKDEEP